VPKGTTENCCELNHEGDACWMPVTQDRWLDNRPRCWAHLSVLLVAHLDEIKAWREGRVPQNMRSLVRRVGNGDLIWDVDAQRTRQQ